MKNYFLAIFLIIFVLCACKTDPTDDGEAPSVEELVEELMTPEQDSNSILVVVQPAEITGLELKLKKVEVDPKEQKRKEEKKKEILTDLIKDSPNIKKTCSEVLEEYEKIVKEYLAAKDKDAVLDKLIKWSNDPIYNNCKKQSAYKARFDQLEDEMYADEDS